MTTLSKKRKITVVIITLLIALTVAFIWYNSLKTQAQSAESSGRVYNTIKSVVDTVFGENTVPITHNGVRKAAHFSEFALLGAEICLLFIVLKKESVKWYLHALPYGLFVAAVDEGLQTLTDRGAALTDVLIDFSGYFAAVAIFLIIFIIKRKIKNKKAIKSAGK